MSASYSEAKGDGSNKLHGTDQFRIIPQPIPITNFGRPQRLSTNHSPLTASPRRPSHARRRLSTSSKLARTSNPLSASLPPGVQLPEVDGLLLLSASAEIKDGIGDLNLDDDDDGEVAPPMGEKGNKKAFQCEKCAKFYRHPACLVKHRWQHTQYWKEASKLMLSKHQSVQMLEAAAILISPGSLPEEKSLWPAAVSPASSGLLGSDRLNIETIRSTRLTSIESEVVEAEPESDQEMVDVNNDEFEMDHQEMFDFDGQWGNDPHRSEHSGSTSGPETASNSDHDLRDLDSGYGSSSLASRKFIGPPLAFGVSAPPLGFFEPRAFGPSFRKLADMEI